MKNIHWSQLSVFEKIVFILGWFSVGSIIFWVAFIIAYIVGKERGGRFREFFNPHTFKVPFVFGWISLLLLALVAFIFLVMGLAYIARI